MKNLFKVTALIMLITVFNCSKEETTNLETNKNQNPNIRITESSDSNSARATINDACYVTNLIAGQNLIVGTASIESDGVDLSVVYRTTGNWVMTDTHMSIGNCAEQWIPINGGGNPKVGKFEGEATHVSATQVTYMMSMSVLDENYCFAAHGVVNNGSSSESAWAEGINFEGRSWAMFVEALKSDCDIDVVGDEN